MWRRNVARIGVSVRGRELLVMFFGTADVGEREVGRKEMVGEQSVVEEA